MISIPAFLTFSVIPMGGPVSMFGHETALQLTDLPAGALAVLAFAAIGVYGIALGGWASGSTYPLLGGLRSAAQLISYEIAMGLSFVAVFLYSGTLSTSGIVAQQESGWYFWLLPVSFVVYAVAMVGETNRAPFDMAEAEGELVGGFNTEYTGMRFGLFFLGEYINVINVSAIATTLFLGGWRAPWPLSLWDGANSGYITFVWFLIKVVLVMFFFVWLRGSLPRIRYDQFMALGWKVLVPVSLAWIVLVGAARVLQQRPDRPHHRTGRALDGRSGAGAAGGGLLLAGRRRPPTTTTTSIPTASTTTTTPTPPPGSGAADRRPTGRPELSDPAAGPADPGAAPATRRPRCVAAVRPSGRETLMSVFDPVKGFGVTFATMFKPVVTEDYPKNPVPTAPRYHGRHQLNRHPDGLEKCVGCELCAWACPADAIFVEGGDNTEEARYSPG